MSEITKPKSVTLRLSAEEHARWLRAALAERRNLSDWLRLTVEDALDRIEGAGGVEGSVPEAPGSGERSERSQPSGQDRAGLTENGDAGQEVGLTAPSDLEAGEGIAVTRGDRMPSAVDGAPPASEMDDPDIAPDPEYGDETVARALALSRRADIADRLAGPEPPTRSQLPVLDATCVLASEHWKLGYKQQCPTCGGYAR